MYTEPYETSIGLVGVKTVYGKITENSNFDILLSETPLFRCKAGCAEVLK